MILLLAVVAWCQPGINEVKNNSNYQETSDRLDALFDRGDPPSIDIQKLHQVQGKSSSMSAGAQGAAKVIGKLGPSAGDLDTQKFKADVLSQMSRVAHDPLGGKSWAERKGGQRVHFSWESVFGPGFLGRKEGLPDALPNYLEPCPLHSFTTGTDCILHSNSPVEQFQDNSLTASFYVQQEDACQGGARFSTSASPAERVALHQYCGWVWPSTSVCSVMPAGHQMCPFGFVKQKTNKDFCDPSARNLDLPPDCTPPLKLPPSKSELEVCGTGYPCSVPRLPTFASPCPRHWTLARRGVCRAPPDYIGPCPVYVKVLQKKWRPNIATVCIVDWD